MLDPFEAALADLLADRLADEPTVAAVGRRTATTAAASGNRAEVRVSVVDGQPTAGLGTAQEERVGERGLRPTLRLSGRVRVTVAVPAGGSRGVGGIGGIGGGGGGGASALDRRRTLWRATDAVLVALHGADVRDGSVLGDDHAQGFALEQLELRSVGEADDEGAALLEVWLGYVGRFWPVDPVPEGELIDRVQARTALLDPELPGVVVASGGGPDVAVPVGLDLRAWGGADTVLVARLAGAAPPGQLVGDATGVPAGAVGYRPGGDGRFRVVFRPAPSIVAPATARVVLWLAASDRPTVQLGEVQIQVSP